MAQNSSRTAGRHFLQIPGPTPVPDRVLRAMDTPIIDHRGPEFAKLAKRALDGIKTIFKTTKPVDHLHRDRHRRLGSRAGQHAVARRPGADGRDRPVRHAVEEDGRASSGSSRNSSRPTGASAPIRRRSRRSCARTRRTRSRRSACCTTRPRPAASRRSPRSARRSTPPAIRRCSWSTPSPRSPRPTTATTNGASTSPSAARRRA